MLRSVEVSLPPADRPAVLRFYRRGRASTGGCDHRGGSIGGRFGQHLAPLADFLLRSESVASSKIEHIDAGWRAFGKAFAGGRASDDAKSQLAAVRALIELVDAANSGAITLQAILEAHRLLMAPDRYADNSGVLRTVQNWVGGSDYSLIGAVYIPPSPEWVPDLIDDLIVFAKRKLDTLSATIGQRSTASQHTKT
jgi:hypothetical protein